MKSSTVTAGWEAMPAALNVTVLGSGTSQGVPMIGCKCAVCRSPDPRDKRTRSSLYVETPTAKILVDTTPDLREQSLREGLDHLDAVIFTHPHADHIMGFDDLRRFCEIAGGPLPVYGSAATLEQVERIFFYGFSPKKAVPGYVHVVPHVIEGPFVLGGIEITPLPVPHGAVLTNGYLFAHQGRRLLAYISDGKEIPAPVEEAVRGVEVLIIDGLRESEHPTHLNVAGAVAAAQAIGAGQAFLTHQTHERTHVERAAGLPPGIGVTYDGMKLSFALA